MTRRDEPISDDERRAGPPSRDVDEATFCRVLAETVARVTAAGIGYVLMGGIGSATHGRPRWTHDVDLFVRPEDAGAVLDVLGDAAFETERTFPDWLFKAFKDGVMVDVIFKSSGGILLDEEMIARARHTEFKGVTVRVIPPEDLVVIKAVVHDEHMPRHWHDALAVLASGPIDWDYLIERACRHGARRTLALLVYAESNDLIVPTRVLRELFERIYEE